MKRIATALTLALFALTATAALAHDDKKCAADKAAGKKSCCAAKTAGAKKCADEKEAAAKADKSGKTDEKAAPEKPAATGEKKAESGSKN